MESHKRVGSLSGFWDRFTKLHRSSWMTDVLPSAPRLSKMWLASQAGPDPKNIIPKVSLRSVESVAVHTAVESRGKFFTSRTWTAHSILHIEMRKRFEAFIDKHFYVWGKFGVPLSVNHVF